MSPPGGTPGKRGAIAFGSVARLLGLGSQFVVLVVLGRMLPKSEFGNMMIAFAVYRIASTCLATGLGNVLLYHVGRSGGDREIDIKLHRSVSAIAILLSGSGMIAGALAAQPLALVFGKPGLAPWLLHMSPMLLFGTLNLTLQGSLDGRSRITTAIMVTEAVPNALRLLGLLLIDLFSLPVLSFAHVMWVSLALPWAWETRYLLDRAVAGRQRWTGWETRYALQFTLWSLASLQLQGIDLLIVGWLFDSDRAGDYAFVSRLATLFPFFHNIIGRQFAPQAAHLLHAGDWQGLRARMAQLKRIDLIAVALSSLAIIAGSVGVIRLLLPSYDSVLPLLLLFAISPIARAFYFGNDKIMQVAGYGAASLAIQLASLSNLVVMSLGFGHLLGLYALPAAMGISSIALNPVMSILVRARLELTFATGRDKLLLTLVTLSVAAAAWTLPALQAAAAACLVLSVLTCIVFAQAGRSA